MSAKIVPGGKKKVFQKQKRKDGIKTGRGKISCNENQAETRKD